VFIRATRVDPCPIHLPVLFEEAVLKPPHSCEAYVRLMLSGSTGPVAAPAEPLK